MSDASTPGHPAQAPPPGASLEAVLAEQDALFYHLSHDLRAPLRAITTFTGVVLEDYSASLDPEAKDLLEKVIGAAALMERLMQNVLAFNRVSRQTPDLAPVDMNKLVGEICAEPQFQGRQGNIQIPVPLLPVRGDATFLRFAIRNLLDNGLKFVAPGVQPKVTISSEPAGDRVRLIFRDNGIGIAAKSQQRIFEMFQRLSSDFEGNGLGLAVVRKALERLGGVVGVDSEPGRGSSFWLELPKG
jgi:signal transduction histidine kinase